LSIICAADYAIPSRPGKAQSLPGLEKPLEPASALRRHGLKTRL
jgi:hypothetical protein